MISIKVIDEYRAVVNGITAVFVDARDGFKLLQNKLDAEADTLGLDQKVYYGDAPSGDAKSVAVSSTLGKRISRNTCDGENCVFVGNMALVSIYSFWEDHYREAIANDLGVKKEVLLSDVMGDIRHLRTAIVHNRSIGTRDVSKCKVLTWFESGDDIFLSEAMYIQMVGLIHKYLETLLDGALQ